MEGTTKRGFLGVGLAEVDDTLHHGNNARLRGAMITHFSGPNSPGLRSGLNPGDVIREINGEPIIDVSHLMRVIGDMRPGQSAKLQVRRGTQLRDLKVEIGQRPSRRS
ncbi:MAG: PDZ domain-containing protein [Planctomycetota bacterium]